MRYLILLVSCVAWGQAWYPTTPNYPGANISLTASIIDASSEKVAFCGQVWTPSGASKSIRTTGFLFGSIIVKAGGSALTLSLQDASTTTGPPMQPDGTQDQTVAVPNASISASTFLMSGNLSADRAVSFGSPLCVVIEFDGSGRLGSDSIQIATANKYGQQSQANVALYTAAWATESNRVPILVFGFSDGTYGTLEGASIFSAYNTSAAYNSASASDEYALKFVPETNGIIDGITVSLTAAASADFDVVLYNGTAVLATTSIDSNWWTPTANGIGFISLPPTAVSASDTYYISIKPTTTNNVTLTGYTVASNSYLGATPQGSSWVRSSRVDGGAWNDSTTIIPAINFRMTATTSGGSSTGGAYVVAQ